MVCGVSIVVPSYQGAQHLPRLFAALSEQRTTRPWELIVVLDGSTDNSSAIAESWAARLPLRTIERPENLGRSTTLNEGFEAATLEVLVRCDDDLVPRPDWIETFGSSVEKSPSDGVMGICRNVFPDTHYARVYGRYADLRFRDEAYASAEDLRWRYWGGNSGVHRDLWVAVGPYDSETFTGYGYEDVDWGYRIGRQGGSVCLVPELETQHQAAATTTSIRLGRAYQSGIGKARFEFKHALEPEPEPGSGRNPWALTVRAGSRISGQAAFERVGHRIDWLLNGIPASAGRRVIDLAIEAAHESGYSDRIAETANQTLRPT